MSAEGAYAIQLYGDYLFKNCRYIWFIKRSHRLVAPVVLGFDSFDVRLRAMEPNPRRPNTLFQLQKATATAAPPRPPPPALRHRRPALRQTGPDLGRPSLRSGSGGLDPGPLCLHSGRGAFV